MKHLNTLKEGGYRITKQRKEILNVLKPYPMTVEELHKKLSQKKIHMDIVSIYRSLELFEKMKMVRVVELGEGKKRFELISEANHHHHVVCNSCGTIKDIEIKEEELIRSIQRKSGFKVADHRLEFFGTCNQCQ